VTRPQVTRRSCDRPPHGASRRPWSTPRGQRRLQGPGSAWWLFEEMEAGLRARLKALPPAARAELIHVLRLPDFDRADRIGEFWGNPETDIRGGPDRLGGGQGCAGGRVRTPGGDGAG